MADVWGCNRGKQNCCPVKLWGPFIGLGGEGRGRRISGGHSKIGYNVSTEGRGSSTALPLTVWLNCDSIMNKLCSDIHPMKCTCGKICLFHYYKLFPPTCLGSSEPSSWRRKYKRKYAWEH